jgi:hypothetical protein
LKKLLLEKKSNFWDQKLQFTYSKASIKDFQVTKEAFSSQKRTSGISKHEISTIYTIFFYFCGSFLPFWIRIQNTDPDPLTRIRNPASINITLGTRCGWRRRRGG